MSRSHFEHTLTFLFPRHPKRHISLPETGEYTISGISRHKNCCSTEWRWFQHFGRLPIVFLKSWDENRLRKNVSRIFINFIVPINLAEHRPQRQKQQIFMSHFVIPRSKSKDFQSWSVHIFTILRLIGIIKLMKILETFFPSFFSS